MSRCSSIAVAASISRADATSPRAAISAQVAPRRARSGEIAAPRMGEGRRMPVPGEVREIGGGGTRALARRSPPPPQAPAVGNDRGAVRGANQGSGQSAPAPTPSRGGFVGGMRASSGRGGPLSPNEATTFPVTSCPRRGGGRRALRLVVDVTARSAVVAALVAAGAFLPAATHAATPGFAFLEIPTGARAAAMGGAFASLASGAEAIFWNPAGARTSRTAFSSPAVTRSCTRTCADCFARSRTAVRRQDRDLGCALLTPSRSRSATISAT